MPSSPLTPRDHSFVASDSGSSLGKRSSSRSCAKSSRPTHRNTWVGPVENVSGHSREDTTDNTHLLDVVVALPSKTSIATMKTTGSSLTYRTTVTPSATVRTAPTVGNVPPESRMRRGPTGPAATCCTIPIAVCFAFMCIVIAAVFGLTTTLSITLFNKQISNGVKTTLSAGLEGTMTYLSGELSATVSMVGQYRDLIEEDPASYACDDGSFTFPGNTSNAGFLKIAGFFAVQRPDLRYIYQSRQSNRYWYPDGRRTTILCMIDPLGKRLRYFINSTSSSVTWNSTKDLVNPMSLVGPPFAYSNLSRTTIETDPFKSTGYWWAPAVISPDLRGVAVPTKFSLFASVKNPDVPDAKWGVGIDHSLVNFRTILLRGTPPVQLSDDSSTPTQYEGAHTTIYDEVTKILLSSTHADVGLTTDDGSAMWKAGKSPSAEVNEAYFRALAQCPRESCTRAVVEIGSENIHSFYNLIDNKTNLHLFVVSVVPKKHYFAESDRVFAITLSLACGCCLLVVAGCIVLLLLIYRPIAGLKSNMLLAAELHNDKVEHSPSYLREINNVSKVFDQMNQQLLIARSFVPEAVLLGKLDDGHEGDDDDEGSIMPAASEKRSQSGSAFDNTTANAAAGNTEKTTSTNSSGGMAKLFNVAEKRVGVLSLNLLNFHALCASRSQRIHDVTTTLLTMVLGCAHNERGVMDSFHGDHFVLTFNASRAVAGPLTAAARTANAFIRQVRADDGLAARGGMVAAGAAAGRSHVGTFGIDGYRRMSVIGDAYRNATALQHAAAQFLRMNGREAAGRGGLREGCLVDEAARKELGCAFHLQVVGMFQTAVHRISHTNPAKGNQLAYFARDATVDLCANGAEDEWLYELDMMEAADPFREPNEAVAALLKGNVGECREQLDKHKASLAKNRESSTYSLTSAREANNSVSTHSENTDADSPAWLLVSRYLNTYVDDLERMSGTTDAVLLYTQRVGLPWVAFQK